MSNKFLRGVIIAFVAVGALIVMIGPLGLSPRKAKFFAVGLCVVLWQSGFLKSKKRYFPAKKEKPIQNSRNSSAKENTISIYTHSNRLSNDNDNTTRIKAKFQSSKSQIAAKKKQNVATNKSRTYFKIRICFILFLGLIAIVYTAKLSWKLNGEWWWHLCSSYHNVLLEDPTSVDGFLGNMSSDELLQYIYDYDRNSGKNIEDIHDYPRPALPRYIYQIALFEAELPKYDIYKQVGWGNEWIANKIANELYVPLIYLIKEGRGWTGGTVLSEEEWNLFDQIMEIRFTAFAGNQGLELYQKAKAEAPRIAAEETRKRIWELTGIDIAPAGGYDSAKENND